MHPCLFRTAARMRVDSNWNAESWEKGDKADKAISILSLPQTVCQMILYGHRLPLQAALSPVSSKHIYNTAIFRVRSRKALTFFLWRVTKEKPLCCSHRKCLWRKCKEESQLVCGTWRGYRLYGCPFLGTNLTVPEHQPSLLHTHPSPLHHSWLL